MSDKCQGKALWPEMRTCPFYACETLGDEHPVDLCGKCMALYWQIVERNPEEADRIRRKVGMRRE